MNRRLLAAAAGLGALSLALVGGTTAGASTLNKATPSTTPPPSVAASPNANLKAGSVVTVTGSGWPDKKTVLITECNADGGGPGDLAGSCDTAAGHLEGVKTSSKGTFTTKYTIVTGPMTAGKPDNDCPQGAVQASDAVQCVIGAAYLTTGAFAFALLHFAAPSL